MNFEIAGFFFGAIFSSIFYLLTLLVISASGLILASLFKLFTENLFFLFDFLDYTVIKLLFITANIYILEMKVYSYKFTNIIVLINNINKKL